MKKKIYDYTRIMDTVMSIFKHEVEECLLKENSKVFTAEYKEKFKISIVPTTVMFVEDELFALPNKTFSRKLIMNTYNDNVLLRSTTPCVAHMLCNTNKDTNKIEITSLFIRVNYDLLVLDVLKHLWDITGWIEKVLKTNARHECGHILDFIMNYDGKDKSVLDNNREKYKAELDEWKKWWEMMSDNGTKRLTDEEEIERLERYFRISDEEIADKLGRVNRQPSIEYEVNSSNKCIDVVIKSKESMREEKIK